MITTKLCRKCGRDLPLSAFTRRDKTGKALSPCGECTALGSAAWFDKNKKRLRKSRTEYMREWRAKNPGYSGRKKKRVNNPDVQKRAKAKYRTTHRDKLNEANRRYYAAHKEQIVAHKRAKKLAQAIGAEAQL